MGRMLSRTHRLPAIVIAALTAGCGARSTLSVTDLADVPRVADCARQAPDAVPLARIVPSPAGGDADPFNIASDADHVYFVSEGRVWRVAKASGAPVALTPPGSAETDPAVSADSVYWYKDGSIYRAPLAGGEPELIGASSGTWAIVGQTLITGGEVVDEPAPIIQTPFGGGAPTEILPADPMQWTDGIVSTADGILVERSGDLVLIRPGGPPVFLLQGSTTEVGLPIDDGGTVYFGAFDSGGMPALQQVPVDASSAPAVVLEGFPVALAAGADTLYANIIVPKSDGVTWEGELLRIPKAGGSPALMTLTDGKNVTSAPGGLPPLEERTGGLQVDAGHVYFIEACLDTMAADYRLVSLPADYVSR